MMMLVHGVHVGEQSYSYSCQIPAKTPHTHTHTHTHTLIPKGLLKKKTKQTATKHKIHPLPCKFIQAISFFSLQTKNLSLPPSSLQADKLLPQHILCKFRQIMNTESNRFYWRNGLLLFLSLLLKHFYLMNLRCNSCP